MLGLKLKSDCFLQILESYLTNYTKIRTLIRLNYVTWTLGAKII